MSILFTINHMKINTVRPQDNIFTNQLTNIANVPDILYYRGTLPKTAIKAVAIVGSRKPTAYGKAVTEKIVHTLAKYNITIISGLALGIDSIAHRAALKFNTPTIAIMARGLDEIYPASHLNLANQIIESGGAVISTYEAGVPARPYHFLRRNEIISGLSSLVVVTEAAVRSGTLNTACHAINQGKEVFVVPGNITSPMSAGCNRLIRQGANPLLHPDDILPALNINLKSAGASKTVTGKNKEEQAVLDSISSGGAISTNQIIKVTGLDAQKVFSTLSMLEISGAISCSVVGTWSISL